MSRIVMVESARVKGTFVEPQHEDEAFPVTIENVHLATKRVYKNGDYIPAYSTDKLDAICQNFSCYAMPENKNNLGLSRRVTLLFAITK